MAELLQNSDYQDFTLEQLKTPEGIARLNAIIRKLAQDMPGDGEGIKIYKGYGTPESSVTAGVSSLYMRLDGAVGTTLYQKQSGTGNTGWVAVPGSSGGGFGDVVGPASATNNAIVLFDGTTGKLIKDSTTLLSSLGNVTTAANLSDNYVIRGDGGTVGVQTNTKIFINDSGVLYLGGDPASFVNSSSLNDDGVYGVSLRWGLKIYGDVDGNPSHRTTPIITFGDGSDTAGGIGYNFSGGSGSSISFAVNYTQMQSPQVDFTGKILVNPASGLSTPTARLHLNSQRTSANTAPLKIYYDFGAIGSDPVLMTTPEAGSLEHGWNLNFTNYKSVRMGIGGTLFNHYADVGNVGTGEDDLYSDTLLANTYATNGDAISAHYAGIFVSSATATRRLKAYLGGTLIYDSTALSLSTSTDWDMKILAIRDSSSSIRCTVTVNTTTASSAPYCTYTRVTGLTLSSTQIIKITGEAAGVGAATDDIVAKLGIIELRPASA